jgi:hypothetical protein
VDSGIVIGAFTLAGTVSGLIVGLVAEYLRERWARERDVTAGQQNRLEERAAFQRQSLLELQAVLLRLTVELADALARPTLDRATLRETVFETGMRAGRIFDSEVRQRVDAALNICVRIRNNIQQGGQVTEAEILEWSARSYAAQARIRELLEEQFKP